MWLKDGGRAISPSRHIPFKSLAIATSVTERQDIPKATDRKINKKNQVASVYRGKQARNIKLKVTFTFLLFHAKHKQRMEDGEN